MVSGDSRVLTNDFTRKKIMDVKVGDHLIDADLNTCQVTFIETESYKNRLRILSFENNQGFCFAESSTLFVEKNGVTTFWVEHPAVLIFQINHLKINSSVIQDMNKIAGEYDVKFATVDGFQQQKINDVTEKYLDQNSLLLTRIETDSYAPIIVEDYLYIPVVNDTEYDYSQLNWQHNSTRLQQLLGQKQL